MDNIKTHYKLSEKQMNLLIIIYRFRFVTALLLGQYKGITAQSMKRSLNILEDSGYIDKRYNSSYKLQVKATIYLLFLNLFALP
jgi:DNA-binding MarR family transcriptional regulator